MLGLLCCQAKLRAVAKIIGAKAKAEAEAKAAESPSQDEEKKETPVTDVSVLLLFFLLCRSVLSLV